MPNLIKPRQVDIELRRQYESRRAKTLVSVRLSEDELSALDEARSGQSRASYVLSAVRKSLGL